MLFFLRVPTQEESGIDRDETESVNLCYCRMYGRVGVVSRKGFVLASSGSGDAQHNTVLINSIFLSEYFLGKSCGGGGGKKRNKNDLSLVSFRF